MEHGGLDGTAATTEPDPHKHHQSVTQFLSWWDLVNIEVISLAAGWLIFRKLNQEVDQAGSGREREKVARLNTKNHPAMT